jgi:hypothetical protein
MLVADFGFVHMILALQLAECKNYRIIEASTEISKENM